jgi:hypothetical protein
MATLPKPNSIPTHADDKAPLWLQIGFWTCVVIGAAAVIRRMFALASPAHNGPPQMAGLDDAFASHATLTLSHIVPAILFVLLSPFAVFRRFASLKWPERILFPLGAIVGLTAYAMTVYSIGGWTERTAIYLFDTLFLYSLARAFAHGQRSEAILKRRWLLRSIAILLGVATARPVMGVFFATSPLTHLGPSQFFGIAMWLGFSINLLVFELWLHIADRRSRSANELPAPSPHHPGRARGYSL